jgi:hypothetical protein
MDGTYTTHEREQEYMDKPEGKRLRERNHRWKDYIEMKIRFFEDETLVRLVRWN